MARKALILSAGTESCLLQDAKDLVFCNSGLYFSSGEYPKTVHDQWGADFSGYSVVKLESGDIGLMEEK